MKSVLRPLFIVSLLVFLAHQLLQWGLKVSLPWADAYLDNFLVTPIVLPLWQAERQWLFKKGKAYRLSIAEVIAATIYILLVTELIFPLLSNRFSADGWDVLFTFAGAVVYLASER
jgi:hypothetical protein